MDEYFRQMTFSENSGKLAITANSTCKIKECIAMTACLQSQSALEMAAIIWSVSFIEVYRKGAELPLEIGRNGPDHSSWEEERGWIPSTRYRRRALLTYVGFPPSRLPTIRRTHGLAGSSLSAWFTVSGRSASAQGFLLMGVVQQLPDMTRYIKGKMNARIVAATFRVSLWRLVPAKYLFLKCSVN